MEWINSFFDINLLSAIIPASYGIYKFKYFEKTIQLVYFFIIVNLILTIISLLPVKSLFGLESNFFVYFLMVSFNIAIKSLIFKSLISKSKTRIFQFSLGLVYFLLLITLILNGYNFKTACIWIVIEALISVSLSFIYLVNFHKKYQGDSLRKEPMFWISLAFFISGVINFLLYFFSYQLSEYDQKMLILLLTFFVPINETLINFLITIGFYLVRKV